MEKEQKEKIIKVLQQIAEDAEKDANNLDGQPFTSKTMATQFGYQLASIKTLAEIVKKILEN